VIRWREHLEGLVLRLDDRVLDHQIDLLGHTVLLRGPGSRPAEQPDHDDAWLTYLIGRSSSFVDLGCSAGAFSVIAALDPDRTVVAVDANTRALRWCADNMISNGLATRARFVLAFMDREDGGTWTPEPHLVDAGFPPHDHVPVPRRSLDGIVRQFDLRPDLVKIDLEGGEVMALQGATSTATDLQPSFHVEMHAIPTLSMVDNAQQVLDWCREVGYTAHYLAEHAPLTAAAQIAARGRCHLLLLPRGAAYPPGLTRIRQGDPISRAAEIPLSP